MNCPMEARQGSELLLEYTAGRLAPGEAAALEAHLESCARCREFARSQKMVWQALEAWEAEPVSLDFDRRLFARIEQAPLSWWARLTGQVMHHAVPVAAAAGVMILAGLMLERPAVTPVAPPQESAQVETLGPEQVQSALDDMQMLRDFNHLVRADSAEPRM
ncbi:MAG: zf-HC2 domain-containing protein [Bryobacteraceae bacterium]